MLEAALAAGIAAAGGDALLGGVLPTPAAPLLIAPLRLRPRRRHQRLAQPVRATTASSSSAPTATSCPTRPRRRSRRARGAGRCRRRRIGRVAALHGTLEDYLRELHDRFADARPVRPTVLLDCANGATYHAAPEIFRRLGAAGDVIADEPDGRNINDGCGSTHVEALAERRCAPGGHDVGFAFDGDGDRVLAVDRTGAVVDGDELIALAALHLRARGRLPGNGVAVTVMTNYGFHTAMRDAGHRGRDDRPSATATCSRSCASAAGRSAASSPATSSSWASRRSGDGIASALLTLEALDGGDLAERARDGEAAAAARQRPRRRPRRRRWRVRRGWPRRSTREQRGAGRAAGACSCARRGTEPLVRVMVEAPTRRGGRRRLRAPRRRRAAAHRADSRRAVGYPLHAQRGRC